MATSTRSGDVLAGRYRLIDLLTESGGGRFWRAHDTILERYVALHVIDEDDPRAPGLVEAARTSAAVLDPRVLRVLDAATEDGRCFVVNEWGTGTSLDILVTHAGPLGPRRAAWLVADVADAIASAHAVGVAHGRLNPENVLIDRYGAVRLIGLCVDAALHGAVPGEVRGDLEDIGGLLYCALTATWPGPSGSIVPAAPREGGVVLSPRQVRAGVPGPLDVLWREFECEGRHDRRRRRLADRLADHPDVGSAAAIAEQLRDFVGDPTGMPEALARSIPPVNELGPVWLPAVADPLPHDSTDDDIPVVRPAAEQPAEQPADRAAADEADPPAALEADDADAAPPSGGASSTDEPTRVNSTMTDHPEAPTEAGIPVFGDGDDVRWLRTHSAPAAPPPPFEEVPERPLFAAGPSRRPAADGYGHGDPTLAGSAVDAAPPPAQPWPFEDHLDDPLTTTAERVPGRRSLRLALGVAVALALLVAVLVAINLGRGRTPLGGEREPASPAPTTSGTPAPAQVLTGVTARDFDPLGTNGENPEDVGALVDGDTATTWGTQTYNDQLGPAAPALKSGVGFVLDLGRERQVASVALRLVEGTGTVQLFAGTDDPQSAPTGEPAATATGSGQLVLAAGPTADARLRARYLTLWWTALPQVSGGFKATVAEVVVRGD
ncbi:hypothetical protein [Nocardioides sp.]|uniref:hypothetical protein n=1 Tax=Nocardioides sp. TaxID=35761 RepID=UPI003519D157